MSPWLLVLVVAIVCLALVAAVWIVGSSLPVHHTASMAACLQRPRQDVWNRLVQVERFADWRPEIESAERLPSAGDRDVWREVSRFGRVEAQVAHKLPLERLVVQMVPEERSFRGSWTYELADCPGGTRLTVTEEGEVHNPFFRFMTRYIFGYHKTMADYLRAMARSFGQDVTPERVF
jgi:hypothetical protein